MQNRPPISDAIITALAKLVDDYQEENRREPSHSEIQFQIGRANLDSADPGQKSSLPVGKAKRVRGVLSWAISNDPQAGESLVGGLIACIQGCGGFRTSSPNFCGSEKIATLADAFSSQGWILHADGTLQPKVLSGLAGKEMTEALRAYSDRARRGALDSPLLVGTAKDFLEATAAHVIVQKYAVNPTVSNFPTLLAQAFVAVGFVTSNDPIKPGELAHKRVERAAFDLACALNAMRNKEGTGHGRAWLSSVTPSQARFSIESMGNIASLMLDAL